MAKRISVINFKGGVGKTTLSFNLAAGLARYHDSRVLLIDVDHQSSLSIVCLGGEEWESCVNNGLTTNEIFKPFIGSDFQMPGDEIINKRPITVRRSYLSRHYEKLHIVPASLQLDDTEIELTASHHGNAIHSEWDKRTLMCKWLEEADVDDKYDYIIFDCPPATKIVSQNAIAASHGYVIPVVPEAVMERGTPHLHQMVKSGIDTRLDALSKMGNKRTMFVPNTELVGIAITRIATSGGYSGYTDDHTQHLHSLQSSWGNLLLKPYIVQGTGISQAIGRGLPVYDMANTQNIGNRGIHTMFEKLTAEIKNRIDAI
jgi:chromosome partitioning protein